MNRKKRKYGFLQLISVYYRQFSGWWIGLIVFTILSCAVTIAVPKLVNIVFNELSMSKNVNDGLAMPWNVLAYWAIGFAFAFVCSGFFLFMQNMIGGVIASKIEIAIRVKVLDKLLELDIQYYEDKKMGNILTKLINDTRIIGEQTSQIPSTILTTAITFVGSIVVLFTLNNYIKQSDASGATTWVNNQVAQWEMTSIVLACAFVVLILTLFLFALLRKVIYRKQQVVSSINGDAADRISVLKLIKISGAVDYEKKRFRDLHKQYYETSLHANNLQSFVMASLLAIAGALNLVAIVIGIVFVNKHMLNPVVMISFTMAINSIISPLNQLLKILRRWANASVSAIRIDEILRETSKIVNCSLEFVECIDAPIVFDHVWFAYNENDDYVLRDFSFSFLAGKSYALVGSTGVGKSTIASLLLRIYEPQQGKIMINAKHSIKDIDLDAYLRLIGYVEQEPQIFYGTFFDNIRYGSFNASDDDVFSACRKAKLDKFITGLPNGYRTILGERGLILSGGQKQRVVIARMFLRNPQLLILDEATSSLDNIVEKAIQIELETLMVGRTTIVIAHRLSTIKHVDQIIVLEKGLGIVQMGTYDELRNAEGKFKKMCEAGEL